MHACCKHTYIHSAPSALMVSSHVHAHIHIYTHIHLHALTLSYPYSAWVSNENDTKSKEPAANNVTDRKPAVNAAPQG